MHITQDYFDQVCLETAELLDDLSDDEVVQESVQQLLAQVPDDADTALSHLTLTFPTSVQGLKERQERKEFVQALDQLQGYVDRRLKEDNESLEDTTDNAVLHDNLIRIQQDLPRLLPLWERQGGSKLYTTLFSHLLSHGTSGNETNSTLDQLVLQTLLATCKQSPTAKSTFQQAVTSRFVVTWMSLYQEPSTLVARERLLLPIAWTAGHHCEENKQRWMTQKDGTLTSIVIPPLVDAVDTLEGNVSDNALWLVHETCRFITVLCTYDDWSSQQSSATTHGRRWAQPAVGLIVVLGKFLKLCNALQVGDRSDSDTSDEANEKEREPPSEGNGRISQHKVVVAVLGCLRAVSTHEESVNAILATDLVSQVKTIWVVFLKNENPEPNKIGNADHAEDILSSCVGFVRNLCAQDDAKQMLCQPEWISMLMQTLVMYPKNASLQDHGCGTIAAMALRSPQNAKALVQAGAHTALVTAMHIHTDRASIQRQGALAIRNLASRSPELRAILLQEGAQEVLYAAAARHANCQDEVYAALRDLGLEAKLVTVNGDDTFGQEFGKTASNFRPVYD